MKRVLVIPAAGRGSRLGWHGPKVLYPVAGQPMLGHLLARYSPLVDRIIVVTAPDALGTVRAYVDSAGNAADCTVQEQPTGMLPAILCARPLVDALSPEEVWITWCDQVAISEATAARLADELCAHPTAALVFPTVGQRPPYIHFARDGEGRIIEVRQRREGDDMPDWGESDAGLFGLRRRTFLEALVEYDGTAATGASTRERNFLPFIPWLAARADVRTFPLADAEEAIGVNTPDDVRRLERFLGERA